MLANLAELAAFVRDVKPESDVHSNLPSHRSPLEENNGFNAAVFTPLLKNNGFNAADVFAACAKPTHWFEGIFFRSAHVRARRGPQCRTKASVPNESKSEPVQLAPRTAPPHDSPHTDADLRSIKSIACPVKPYTLDPSRSTGRVHVFISNSHLRE